MFIKKRLTYIICCFIVFVSFSQNKNQDYKTAFNKWNAKAVAIARTQQDSAYFYLKEAIKIAENEKKWRAVMDSYFEIYNVSFYHFNKPKLQEALHKMDSLYKKQESYFNQLNNTLKYQNHISYYYGFYYFKLNKYKASKKAFLEIIDKTENATGLALAENKNFLSVSYSYVAKMLTNEGQYELAKLYYKKNIRLIGATNPDLLHANYSLLAEVLKKENKHEASNSYFIKSLQYQKQHKSTNSILSSCFNIAQNYVKTKKLDSAKIYLKEAKKHLTKTHVYNSNYLNIVAEVYNAEENFEKALEALEQVLEFYNTSNSIKKQQNLAVTFSKIGALYAKYNQPEKALLNYNKATTTLPKNNSTLKRRLLLNILKQQSIALNTTFNFKKSETITNKAVSILDSLKPSFKNKTDKLFLIEEAFPIFESGLEACYNLYQKTKQDSLINKAFFYTEKSKSNILLEAILSSQATSFANIPKSIIEEEAHLKSKINTIEKKLNKQKKEGLEEELFQLKNSYSKLISNIETNHKAYYNLKYNTQVTNLTKAQELLNPDDILVSYFYGNQAIYSITITKNSKAIQQFKKDSILENNIVEVYKMLKNPKSNLEELNNKSLFIYNKIVAPNLIETDKKNLILITDGLLNYIPFSSLNTKQNPHKYLVEEYAVSYINSVTLLEQLLKEKPNTNHKILAFAPDFNSVNSSLLALPNNKKEANNILQFFKGKALTADQASLTNFNLESSNYGILHFATHAILNDSNPEYSYLAFQPNNETPNLLYVSDLYNLNLNTNLVTLSACESGIGNLKRGEGFLSLARGFYFSGVSSIASTLWKINDASTQQIMENFYKNLGDSNTKNIALQKAQLQFLKTNQQNGLTHPYYWSSFVISGNTNALNSSSNLLWYMLAATIFILIGATIRKRKTTN
ncbi:MAG: CHAT domain-containing protein [Oceanihabitans sp.]